MVDLSTSADEPLTYRIPIGEPLDGPSALSEPDRSERISGIYPEMTYQCGKGHTTTMALNVVCDRPFFAVSKPREVSANRPSRSRPDGSGPALTGTSSLGRSWFQAYRPESNSAGGGANRVAADVRDAPQSYAITKDVAG